ncbi:SH3 domain-containing protein [Maridesulfovibrio frigidus]|uniref:SH3 domain-containing protein n=1 Tax=Maridesulfovibrio frigidus TaxID=340956 RepID=UPI0004E19E96|nr:SH3 domain-containing protein [Maridesulfovibrio frigidus]
MRLRLFCCLLLSASFLFAGCIPTKKPSPHDSVQSQVQTQTVIITPIVTGTSVFKSNVRAKASSKSQIVDVLQKGSQVEIIGKNKNWYQVKRSDNTGTSGFVFHKLIHLDFENYLGTQGRNKDYVSIHNAPSATSATVLKIKPSTTFDILGFENNFYKIKGEYFEGYVIADLCVADPSNPIAKTKIVTVKSSAPAMRSSASSSSATTSKTTTKSSYYKPSKKKVTTSKKPSGADSALTLFGAFASAFTGGSVNGGAAPAQNSDDALKGILNTINTSKELAKTTIAIREQMLTSLNETRALQSLIGKTVYTMNQNFKTASETARGVSSTGMEKISIKAFINDLSYEPTTTIESASVKIAENGRMLKNLATQIKAEAASFSKLNASQLQNLDSIIRDFSNNIHASNAMYDFSIQKSNKVILGIDRAIMAFEEKAGPLTVEATKQLGVLAISASQLVAQLSNVQSNPFAALAAIPRIMEIQEQVSDLTSLLSDFNEDYEYIEKNSSIISKQGMDINSILMTARRKNTQVTTMLESYYEKKVKLSERLQNTYAKQAEEGFEVMEKKAESVALAEDVLD